MKKLFNALTPKKFTLLAIFFALLGDLLLFTYIYNKFSGSYDLYKSLMKIALEGQGISINNINENFLIEQFSLIIQLLVILIGILILFHFVVYILFLLKKKFGTFYLKIYSAVAIPGCAMMMLSVIWKNPLLGLSFGLQALLYLMIFKGIMHFTPKE